MTYPPQPGQWDPSAQPPGPPQPPPGSYPPPGWSPQPPPQNQGGGLKWLLIGVAILLVIAITIGATLFFTRDGSGPSGTNTTAAPPNNNDVASANDTGPVSIITFDPTCPSWRTIQTRLANAESKEWGDRDQSSESSSWSPQVRAQYEAVGAAMRSAADQVVGLAKQTPHRVMREMYEQFVAYGRAYADSLSSYEPKDDLLSLVNIHFGGSIAGVCDAIDHGAIAARAPLVPPAQSPSLPPSFGDLGNPRRFLSGPSPSCLAWVDADSKLQPRLLEWQALDSGIVATAWTPEQRNVMDAVTHTFESYATTMETIGRQEKGTFEDFSTLAALYLRGYAAAVPSYTLQDSWISVPGLSLNSAIRTACRASAG